ncbi:MAG: ribulose-phosphate 3-epimerase [Ruminococcaceae bacterium]|nr:ribulose-phosphate 3-epimerase [Oscillospiraceae bacterium]
MAITLAPSLLAADFTKLAEEVSAVEKAGAEYLHLDVMDGHLVPNISFGVPVIQSLRSASNMVFDAHLMISEPHKYVEAFAKAGSDIITIHVESDSNIGETLGHIKSLGKKAGLALNPDAALERAIPYFNQIDMLLIMSVYAGFGGQKYIMDVNEKISEARRLLGPEFDIQVDGGVYLHNLSVPVSAGANVIVAGSAIFGSDNPAQAVLDFKAATL